MDDLLEAKGKTSNPEQVAVAAFERWDDAAEYKAMCERHWPHSRHSVRVTPVVPATHQASRSEWQGQR